MKIGIIGSGGREHAICISLKNSNKINKLFCFPGNAGTEEIAENINIDTNDFESIKNFIIDNNIDLVVVGPEQPLVGGLVDYLEKFKIKVFGPNKMASNLKVQKYSQNYRNLIFPQLNLVYFKIKTKQTIFKYNKIS